MGLSKEQVAGVQNTWTTIYGGKDRAGKKAAGIDFFIVFFEKTKTKADPDGYQKFFSALVGMSIEELKTSKKLHAHAMLVMNYVNHMVESLEDGEVLTELLRKNARTHLMNHITDEHFKKLAEIWPGFVEKHLGRKLKPVEREAWDIVWTVIIGAISAEVKNLKG